MRGQTKAGKREAEAPMLPCRTALVIETLLPHRQRLRWRWCERLRMRNRETTHALPSTNDGTSVYMPYPLAHIIRMFVRSRRIRAKVYHAVHIVPRGQTFHGRRQRQQTAMGIGLCDPARCGVGFLCLLATKVTPKNMTFACALAGDRITIGMVRPRT